MQNARPRISREAGRANPRFPPQRRGGFSPPGRKSPGRGAGVPHRLKAGGVNAAERTRGFALAESPERL